MIRLTPTKDSALVLSFIRGPALLKKCMGGVKVDTSKIKEFIETSKATFLVATEDGRGLGFVVLNPEYGTAASIHLCLRTIGAKTKKIFALSIMYVQHIMGLNTVHAVFPKEYRACLRLTHDFGFRDDPSLKAQYPIESELPYVYKRLDLI